MNKLEKIYEDLKANGRSIPEDLAKAVRCQQRGRKLSGKEIRDLERDKQILPLLATGYNTEEIASKINLSESTTYDYITNMLLRYNCLTRPQLIAKTLAMGIFQNPLAPMNPDRALFN